MNNSCLLYRVNIEFRAKFLITERSPAETFKKIHIYLHVWKSEKETEREIFHPLGHSPNGHSSQNWADLKLEAKTFLRSPTHMNTTHMECLACCTTTPLPMYFLTFLTFKTFFVLSFYETHSPGIFSCLSIISSLLTLLLNNSSSVISP